MARLERRHALRVKEFVANTDHPIYCRVFLNDESIIVAHEVGETQINFLGLSEDTYAVLIHGDGAVWEVDACDYDYFVAAAEEKG